MQQVVSQDEVATLYDPPAFAIAEQETWSLCHTSEVTWAFVPVL